MSANASHICITFSLDNIQRWLCHILGRAGIASDSRTNHNDSPLQRPRHHPNLAAFVFDSTGVRPRPNALRLYTLFLPYTYTAPINVHCLIVSPVYATTPLNRRPSPYTTVSAASQSALNHTLFAAKHKLSPPPEMNIYIWGLPKARRATKGGGRRAAPHEISSQTQWETGSLPGRPAIPSADHPPVQEWHDHRKNITRRAEEESLFANTSQCLLW